MSKLVVVTTRNEATIVDYPDTTDLSYEVLHDTVNGYIEILNLKDVTMVVNEEGKLDNLPTNLYATYLFMKSYAHLSDMIVGDVAFLSNRLDGNGNMAGFTEAEATNFVLDFQMFIDDARSEEIERREARALEHELRYAEI